MDEQNQNIQTTTTLADLKTAFDQAVEERKIIDAKIAEIKKQIQAQRQQYEDLDKKTDIYADNATGLPIPHIPVPDLSVSETLKSLFRLIVKYLIPIIIILAFLGIYLHRNAVHASDITPIETAMNFTVEEVTHIINQFIA